MENNTFKEYLENSFKNMKWTSSKTQKILFWVSLPIFIIFLISIFAFMTQGKGLLIFLVIGAIASFVTMLVSGIIWSSNRRSNKKLLFSYIPKDIYQKYYELTYPNNVLQFEGLYNSRIFPGHQGFNFKINDEHVWWDIKEHTEIRTRTVSTKDGTTTETYTVYILDYAINLASHRLKGYEPITLTTNSKLKKAFSGKNNENEFYSASITFNQKFKVMGRNQMQMTRLFDPSVIDYFDNMTNLDLYKRHSIHIKDSWAYTNWNSGDSLSPWGGNLNNFEYLRITKQNYVNEITKRVENDFNRFFQMLYLFRPFDFYRIYQQKN